MSMKPRYLTGLALAATLISGLPLHAITPVPEVIPMTPNALQIAPPTYAVDPTGAADSTAGILAALNAAPSSPATYAGPNGTQHVVYLPPGTYRLNSLQWPALTAGSNIRLEIDAGAVLEQVPLAQEAQHAPVCLMYLGDHTGTQSSPVFNQIDNVSIVGVNQLVASATNAKAPGYPAQTGWCIDNSFTINLNCRQTGGDPNAAGLRIFNVSHFLIRNVFTIQNDDHDATYGLNANGDPLYENSTAALALNADSMSPAAPANDDNSPPDDLYLPRYGEINNWYNVHGPRGYGPNQINAGQYLEFKNIFTQGGTAMRFETDASQNKGFGAEVYGVTATNIMALNGNRAVSFAPHSQTNRYIYVSGVRAVSCWDGIVESADEGTGPANRGFFFDCAVDDCQVTGGATLAQVPNQARSSMWTYGQSDLAYSRDESLDENPNKWAVRYSAYTCFYDGSSPFNPHYDINNNPIPPTNSVYTELSGTAFDGTNIVLLGTTLPNQLANPGFESGTDSWKNWAGNSWVGSPLSAIHSGLAAAHLVSSTTSDIAVQQIVPIVANSVYVVSGYVRGDATITNGAQIRITFLNSTGGTLGSANVLPIPAGSPNGDYQFCYPTLPSLLNLHPFTPVGGSVPPPPPPLGSTPPVGGIPLTFTPPSGAAQIKVDFRLLHQPTTATADFDDFTLIAVPNP